MPSDVIWDTHFEDGWGVVIAVGVQGDGSFGRSYEDYEHLMMDDILTFEVYMAKDGAHHIFAKAGAYSGSSVHTDLLLSKHCEHELKVLRSKHQIFQVPLTVYAFRWPRKGP